MIVLLREARICGATVITSEYIVTILIASTKTQFKANFMKT